MALLATSCTLRDKPSRLLDKGPDYLKTKTNSQIFEHRRRSAVELLAASRPYYVKSAALLVPSPALAATTPDRHCKSIFEPQQRPPRRSKSEWDVSKLKDLLIQDETDSDCSAPGGGREEARARRESGDEGRPPGEGESAAAGPSSGAAVATTSAATLAGGQSLESSDEKINTAPDTRDECRPFSSSRPDTDAVTAASTAALPSPSLPLSPSPPPPLSPTPKPTPPPPARPALPPKPASLSLKPALPPKPSFLQAGGATAKPPLQAPAPVAAAAPVTLYTARPIFISLSSLGRTDPPPTTPSTPTTPTPPHAHLHSPAALVPTPAGQASVMSEESSDKTPTNPHGGDMSASRSSSSVLDPAPDAAAADVVAQAAALHLASSSPLPPVPPPGGVAAVSSGATPTPTSATSSPDHRGGASLRSSREFLASCGRSPVPRSFSDIACHGHHSRAGSDVSSEASRASRHSRASRASAGAHLEKFFNEMGMEPNILDPMMAMQRRRGGRDGSEQDIYESVSSLDSHDARSICSALSRSERELSDAEAFERNQAQTSVVERNARIIKWLCSVKKAKTPSTAGGSVQGSAAS